AAGETRATNAAADDAIDGDRGAALEAVRAGTERLDPAGRLVSERERRPHAERVRCVDDVEVRMTDAGAADAEQRFAGTRLGRGNVREGDRARCDQAIGAHALASLDVVCRHCRRASSFSKNLATAGRAWSRSRQSYIYERAAVRFRA